MVVGAVGAAIGVAGGAAIRVASGTAVSIACWGIDIIGS